jgi:hypothetical protein
MSENLCAEPIEVSPEKFHLDKGKNQEDPRTRQGTHFENRCKESKRRILKQSHKAQEIRAPVATLYPLAIEDNYCM